MRVCVLIALSAVAAWITGVAEASALVTIDQEPIYRVVRTPDIPGTKNEELPSGALTVTQFAQSDDTRSASAREVQILDRAGYRSAAISEFYGPGRVTWKSTAVELRSPTAACGTMLAQATLDANTDDPPHDSTSITQDHAFRHSLVVTFTAPKPEWAGGAEVLACTGDYLFTLQELGKPGIAIRQQPVDRLLVKVVARRP